MVLTELACLVRGTDDRSARNLLRYRRGEPPAKLDPASRNEGFRLPRTLFEL